MQRISLQWTKKLSRSTHTFVPPYRSFNVDLKTSKKEPNFASPPSSSLDFPPLRRFTSTPPKPKRKKFSFRDDFSKISERPFIMRLLRRLCLALGGGLLLAFGTFKVIAWHERIDEEANDFATMLPLGENIWSIRYHFQKRFDNIAYSSNMFIIRLEGGGLLIYNPVKLTPRIKYQLLLLKQPVKYLIIPNGNFVDFYSDYIDAFPSIQCFCAPTTNVFMELNALVMKKRDKELSNRYIEDIERFTVMDSNPPPNTWHRDELDQVVFYGFFPEELVMFHRPSGVLLTCGLISNLSSDSIALRRDTFIPLLYRHTKILGGPPLAGYFIGKSHPQVLDPIRIWEGVQRIRRWPFSTIGMAQGEPLPFHSPEDAHTFWELTWMNMLHPFFQRENIVMPQKRPVSEVPNDNDDEY